jgi:hypothetical protein
LYYLSLGAVAAEDTPSPITEYSKDTKDHNETNLNDVDPIEPVHLGVNILKLVISISAFGALVLSKDNNKDHEDRNGEKERNDVRNLIRVHFFN